MAVIKSYITQFRREIAQQDLRRIKHSKKDQLFFLWAGETVLGKPFYYRLQGPSFILEFDHWHADPTHTHSVWRDKDEVNLLRENYKKFRH